MSQQLKVVPGVSLFLGKPKLRYSSLNLRVLRLCFLFSEHVQLCQACSIPLDGISVCISLMSPHVCWVVFDVQVGPMSGKANLGKDFWAREKRFGRCDPRVFIIFFRCCHWQTGFDLGGLLIAAWLFYGNFQSITTLCHSTRITRITRLVACEGFKSNYFQEIGKRPHGQNKLGVKAPVLKITISMGLGPSRLLLLSGKPTWNPSMPNPGDFGKGGAPCAPGSIEGNLKAIIASAFKVYTLEYFFEVTNLIYYP